MNKTGLRNCGLSGVSMVFKKVIFVLFLCGFFRDFRRAISRVFPGFLRVRACFFPWPSMTFENICSFFHGLSLPLRFFVCEVCSLCKRPFICLFCSSVGVG